MPAPARATPSGGTDTGEVDLARNTGCPAPDGGKPAQTPAQERHLAAIADFSARLGDGKLKRGLNGHVSVRWVARGTGVPATSILSDAVLLDAALALEKAHEIEGDPAAISAWRMLQDERLARIAALPAKLGDNGLRRGRAGLVHVGWAAEVLHIPAKVLHGDWELMKALQGLRDVHHWEPTETAPDIDASAGRRASGRRPRTTSETPPSRFRPATEDEVAHALSRLDDYDQELEDDGGRVPCMAGRPARRPIAKRLGCRAQVLQHTTVEERLTAVACRHGLETGAHGILGDRRPNLWVKRELANETATLALREEAFAPSVQGGVSLAGVADSIDAPRQVMYQLWFRAHAAAAQRTLTAALSMPMLTGPRLETDLLDQVMDQYGDDVAAGLMTPPFREGDILDTVQLERTLGFVRGTSKRFPIVAERMAAIAASALAARADGRAKRAEERRLDFLMAQFTALGDTMEASGKLVRIDDAGAPSRAALEVALKAQLGPLAAHDMVVDAIDRLKARVGTLKAATKGRRSALRTLTDADIAVDRHCDRIAERCIPMTAEHIANDRALKGSLALDLGVAPDLLTSDHLARVRLAARRAGAPDREKPRLAGTRLHDEGLTPLFVNALSRPAFDKGLPGDPLDDENVDVVALGKATGIAPGSLARLECYLAPMREKVAQVGIRKYAGDAQGITFAQLLSFGRSLRRAEADTDSNPSRRAASSADALEHIMALLGRSPADLVGLSMDQDLSDALGASDLAAELRRWRIYLVRLIVHLDPETDLATTLKLLCRAIGTTPWRLRADGGLNHQFPKWAIGQCEPSWSQDGELAKVDALFDLPTGYLAERINADFRKQGAHSGPERIAGKHYAHLPHRFWTLGKDQRLDILNDIASNVAVQTSARSRRREVVRQDKYRLPFKRWPKPLKDEFDRFITLKEGDTTNANTDLDDLFADELAVVEGEPITKGGRDYYKGLFEGVFGFLTLPTSFTEEQRLIDPRTQDWRRDAALVLASKVDYVRRPGLGIPVEHLSFGLLGLWQIGSAFMLYKRNRAGHYDAEALVFANQCQVAVRQWGHARADATTRKATGRFLSWWHDHQEADVKAAIVLPRRIKGEDDHDALCNAALIKYETAYKKLKKRRLLKGAAKLQQGRDPFAAIMAVVGSDTPVAIYRRLLQLMKANRPPLSRPHQRHRHVRDCLVAMILLQTFLRVKNLAQLTYRADGSGQLRKVHRVWHVRIHKSRFKNHYSLYFRDGEYFDMPLRDEDGLYDLIDEYLTSSREFIHAANGRHVERADGEAAPGGRGDGDEGEGDVEPDYRPAPEDDEEGDNYEDEDTDGELAEARFFIQSGGRQFLPSQMTGLYRFITGRYLAASPYRGRGLRGLEPHGPHSVRHVGATDALATTGSWEKAAQMIHDAVRTVKRVYVSFSPTKQGTRAAETGAAGRDREPVYADGCGLLDTRAARTAWSPRKTPARRARTPRRRPMAKAA